MLITELAKSRGETLTATDRRLIAVLQSQPAEAAFWFAADVTEPLGLHQSAATRLAQRLGFEGYPRLRDALRQDYLSGGGPSQRVRGRLERHPDDVLAGFVEDEVAALAALPGHVAQQELDDLAERITGARQVLLFGQGNATALVDLLQRRLRRNGILVTVIQGSVRDVAEGLAVLEDDDLVLACAFRRTPRDLTPLLEIARARGSYVAVITDTLLSLSPQPDAVLAAPRGGVDDFLSLTVPMAIANALVLTVARRSPQRAIRALDRLEAVLERFER